MTAAPSPSKKRSLLRKFLYLAAAAVLLGSLLLSYMQWEANTLRFRETQAPAGCLPGLSGLRILVLSDVHTGLPMLEEAVHMAEQAKPPGRPLHGLPAGHPCRRLHQTIPEAFLHRSVLRVPGQP